MMCRHVKGIYESLVPVLQLGTNAIITCLLCRQVEDSGDVMELVESDDEQIFQDAVPQLPPLTNGCHTTLVQIHRIPSSMAPIMARISGFMCENLKKKKPKN